MQIFKKASVLILCMIITLLLCSNLTVKADEITNETTISNDSSDFKVSESLIEIIKDWEGFCKYPYWDYGQWSVGYGTGSPKEDLERFQKEGITEEEATELLNKYIEKFSDRVNGFIKRCDLTVTQNQFDAMVSFSYNCGVGWLYENSSPKLAIINGSTGSDFIDAWAQWSSAGGETLEMLIKRRLSEANMYLNNVYSKQVPDGFNYVIYDGRYGRPTRKVQAFVGDSADVKSTIELNGYKFHGWYDKLNGGNKIEKLTKELDKHTIYAQWEGGSNPSHPQDSNTDIQSVVVDSYEVVITADKLSGFASPVKGSTIINTFYNDEYVTVKEEYVDSNGVKWGKTESDGWFNLNYAKKSEINEHEKTPIEITSNYVNIRRGPGLNYPKIGRAFYQEKYNVFATKQNNGYNWGKIEKGWIALKYTNYDNVIDGKSEPEINENQPTRTGTVKVNYYLNVRSGPGTNYAIVGSLNNGTKVEIVEQKNSNGLTWGKMSNGNWIAIKYIVFDKEQEDATEPTVPETTIPATEPTTPETTVPETTVPETTEPIPTEQETVPTEPETQPSEPEPTTQPTTPETVPPTTAPTEPETVPSETVPEPTEKPTEPTVEPDKDIQKGRVNVNYFLRVRNGPGLDHEIIDTKKRNDIVSIYETKEVDGMTWGRIDDAQWLSMDYIILMSPNESLDNSQEGVVKVNYGYLRIRESAGTDSKIIGYLRNGHKVTITKTTNVGNVKWGFIGNGWISLDYVKLISSDSEEPVPENSNVRNGKVKLNSDALRVRKGPGLTHEVIGFLYNNHPVTIYETKNDGNMDWGRIGTGKWISLNYVLFD